MRKERKEMSSTFIQSAMKTNRTKAAHALGAKPASAPQKKPQAKPATTKPAKSSNSEAKTKKEKTPKDKPKKMIQKKPAASVKKAASGKPSPAKVDRSDRSLTLSSVHNIATLGGIATMSKEAEKVLREFLHKNVLVGIAQIGSLQARKCGRFTINPEDVANPLIACGVSIDMTDTISRNAQKKKEREDRKKKENK